MKNVILAVALSVLASSASAQICWANDYQCIQQREANNRHQEQMQQQRREAARAEQRHQEQMRQQRQWEQEQRRQQHCQRQRDQGYMVMGC